MNMRTVREALLLCAAALAVACAVLLPPFLSRLSDRDLETAQYAVQAETLDVSLVYQMSTAQRLALVDRFYQTEGAVLSIENGQPAQDELSGGQAAALGREEMDRLYELGVLPKRTAFSNTLLDARYLMLCDREDRRHSVSLWVLSALEDTNYGYRCDLMLDAQTGLIYYLRVVLDGAQEFSPEDAARAWGTYLGLGAPTVRDTYEIPPSQGESDLTVWVGQSYQYLCASYETDDGTVSCCFRSEQDLYSKMPVTIITITPFTPSGLQ